MSRFSSPFMAKSPLRVEDDYEKEEKKIKENEKKGGSITKGMSQEEVVIKADPKKFKRYGSARNLYNFKIDNVSSY